MQTGIGCDSVMVSVHEQDGRQLGGSNDAQELVGDPRQAVGKVDAQGPAGAARREREAAVDLGGPDHRGGSRSGVLAWTRRPG